MVGNHPAGKKVEISVKIVVIPTFQSNVLPMAKMFQMQEESFLKALSEFREKAR